MINNTISEAKFDAVQELVDKQDFDGARAILKTIDNPTAREWEHKIDILNPRHKISNRAAHLIISVIAFAIGGIALIIFLSTLLDYRIDNTLRLVTAILAIIGFVVAYVTNKLGRAA